MTALTDASARLRHLADNATPGPWQQDVCNVMHPCDCPNHDITGEPLGCPHILLYDIGVFDAGLIACMDPVTVRAVADLLDALDTVGVPVPDEAALDAKRIPSWEEVLTLPEVPCGSPYEDVGTEHRCLREMDHHGKHWCRQHDFKGAPRYCDLTWLMVPVEVADDPALTDVPDAPPVPDEAALVTVRADDLRDVLDLVVGVAPCARLRAALAAAPPVPPDREAHAAAAALAAHITGTPA